MKIEYIYFPSGRDYSEILGDRVKDFKITMERLEDVEILARSEYGIIGKMGGIEFIAAADVDLPETDVLKKTVIIFDERVEIPEAEGYKVYEDFTLGKIKFSKNTIYVICQFDEDFFYSAFPVFDIHLARAFLLISNNETVAKELNNKEKVVTRRVTELSAHVKSSDSIPDLEAVVSELSSIQADLFTKLVRFRDHNEEILESLNKAEYVARLYFPKIKSVNLELQSLQDRLSYLRYVESSISQTVEGVRDVLNLVKIRLDVIRNREFAEIQKSLSQASAQNVEIQKRTSALQAAAIVIEFVAVFYYTLKSWEYFMGNLLAATPVLLKFITLTVFTSSVVYYTKAIAGAFEKGKLTRKVFTTTILVLLALLTLYLIPTAFSGIQWP